MRSLEAVGIQRLVEILENRDTYEYYAILGIDKCGEVIMAARVDNCETIQLLEAAHWVDSTKMERGKLKEPRTKAMVCEFVWRQNVGHVGKTQRLCGVHGLNHTMARKGSETKFKEWWDRLAGLITQFNVNFLGGDFNMSLTQVVVELCKRGIKADSCAWTPWLHESAAEHGSRSGIDSVALFYIAGGVLC